MQKHMDTADVNNLWREFMVGGRTDVEGKDLFKSDEVSNLSKRLLKENDNL